MNAVAQRLRDAVGVIGPRSSPWERFTSGMRRLDASHSKSRTRAFKPLAEESSLLSGWCAGRNVATRVCRS